jgi:hypothetical protein
VQSHPLPDSFAYQITRCGGPALSRSLAQLAEFLLGSSARGVFTRDADQLESTQSIWFIVLLWLYINKRSLAGASLKLKLKLHQTRRPLWRQK